jgi:hypothetical protein
MPKEDVIDVPAVGEGLCVHKASTLRRGLVADDVRQSVNADAHGI